MQVSRVPFRSSGPVAASVGVEVVGATSVVGTVVEGTVVPVGALVVDGAPVFAALVVDGAPVVGASPASPVPTPAPQAEPTINRSATAPVRRGKYGTVQCFHAGAHRAGRSPVRNVGGGGSTSRSGGYRRAAAMVSMTRPTSSSVMTSGGQMARHVPMGRTITPLARISLRTGIESLPSSAA